VLAADFGQAQRFDEVENFIAGAVGDAVVGVDGDESELRRFVNVLEIDLGADT
jgi:hypothetical protein